MKGGSHHTLPVSTPSRAPQGIQDKAPLRQDHKALSVPAPDTCGCSGNTGKWRNSATGDFPPNHTALPRGLLSARLPQTPSLPAQRPLLHSVGGHGPSLIATSIELHRNESLTYPFSSLSVLHQELLCPHLHARHAQRELWLRGEGSYEHPGGRGQGGCNSSSTPGTAIHRGGCSSFKCTRA